MNAPARRARPSYLKVVRTGEYPAVSRELDRREQKELLIVEKPSLRKTVAYVATLVVGGAAAIWAWLR